jgi:hypothetical protein
MPPHRRHYRRHRPSARTRGDNLQLLVLLGFGALLGMAAIVACGPTTATTASRPSTGAPPAPAHLREQRDTNNSSSNTGGRPETGIAECCMKKGVPRELCKEDPFLQLNQQPLRSLAKRLSTEAFFDDWTNMTTAGAYLHCVLGGEEGGFAANASACCHQMQE